MTDINTEDKVKKIHNEVLGILSDIDEFCNRNNITYFLSGGTLLGAIRHKGFIPWDDDGDIMLCRDEYERFFDGFSKYYGEKYGIGELSVDPDWLLPYGIIWSKRTTLKSTNLNSNEVGVGVDIFPIDGLSSNRLLRKLFFGKIRILNAMRNACIRESFLESETNHLPKKLLAIVVKPFGARKFAEMMERTAKRKSVRDSKKVGSSAAVHYGERETMDAESVDSALRTKFEGKDFSIPVGYEQYLSNLYGDYMIIPEDAKNKGMTHLDHWNVEFRDDNIGK